MYFVYHVFCRIGMYGVSYINFKSCMYSIFCILVLEIAISSHFMGLSGQLEFFLNPAHNIFYLGPILGRGNKILLFIGWSCKLGFFVTLPNKFYFFGQLIYRVFNLVFLVITIFHIMQLRV